MSNLKHHSGDSNYGRKMRDVGKLAFGECDVSSCHLLSWTQIQSLESDEECAMFPHSPREVMQSPGQSKVEQECKV